MEQLIASSKEQLIASSKEQLIASSMEQSRAEIILNNYPKMGN